MGQRKSRPIFDCRDFRICSDTNIYINVYSPIQQSAGLRFCVEEGVFAAMDSASAFDDLAENPPTMNINTTWVNQLCAWGVELVEMDENLDEKLFEEWLQEKVNMSSKQFSGAVTAVEE